MDDVTKKWAAWADAAEEYAKAASVVEAYAGGREAAVARLRAAVDLLGSDPCGLLDQEDAP